MATEENKEAEAEAEQKNSAVKNIVHILEDENSYINSAKERMNDVIDTFITRFGDLTGSFFVGLSKLAALSITVVPLLAIPFAGIFSFTGYKISKIFEDKSKNL